MVALQLALRVHFYIVTSVRVAANYQINMISLFTDSARIIDSALVADVVLVPK